MRTKHRTSYPRPQELAENAETDDRKEDCSRGTIWTDQEIAWLTQNYPHLPGRMCAASLRRSENAVRVMICRLKQGREPQRLRKTKLIAGNVSRLAMDGARHE